MCGGTNQDFIKKEKITITFEIGDQIYKSKWYRI